MASTKYLSIVFTGEDKSATKTFRQVDDAADNTGSKLQQLGSKISPAVAAASAAVVAGVGFAMKAAFDAATESSKVARETERVLTTTGSAAWTTADQVGDLATSISNLTGKDDELIQQSANLLLTFTNVKNSVGEGNDVFDQAVGLTLDMATALGTDASGASIQLGKALNDPIKGITALSRAGVSFTGEQKEQIRTLVETGDVLGAQKIILGELSREFGGAAEAAKTPIETLRTKLDNLAEDVGTVLMPVIGGIADAVGTAVDSFMTLPDPIKNISLLVMGVGTTALAAVPLIAKIADTFGDVVGPAMGLFRRVVDSVAIGVGELATKFGASQDMGAKLASGLSSAVTPALLGVTAAAVIGFGIWTMYQNAQKENEQRSRDFTDALKGETSAIKENLAAVITKQLADNGAAAVLAGTTANIGIFTDAITTNGDALEETAHYATALSGTQLVEKLRDLANNGNASAAEMVRLADSSQLTTDQIRTLATGLDQTSDAYDSGKASAEVYTTVTDGIAKASGQATTNTLAQIASLKDLADELRAQTDPWFAAYKGQQQVEAAQTKLNEATAKYGPSSREAKDAAVASAEAAIGLKGDLIKLKEANLDGAGAPELTDQLKGLTDFGFDPASEAARNAAYDILTVGARAEAIDGTTTTVTVNSNAGTVAGEFRALMDSIKAVYNPKSYNFTYYPDAGIDGNHYTPYAKGGMVNDGWFTVGEQGPELGRKIGSSVQIFSNPESKRMMSSASADAMGSVNVYVNQPEASAYDIGRELLWTMKVAG